ncbi:MAG: hypothetical protein PXY39_00140 [archaeon]|nr:hypothetical protein [archaeon]
MSEIEKKWFRVRDRTSEITVYDIEKHRAAFYKELIAAEEQVDWFSSGIDGISLDQDVYYHLRGKKQKTKLDKSGRKIVIQKRIRRNPRYIEYLMQQRERALKRAGIEDIISPAIKTLLIKLQMAKSKFLKWDRLEDEGLLTSPMREQETEKKQGQRIEKIDSYEKYKKSYLEITKDPYLKEVYGDEQQRKNVVATLLRSAMPTELRPSAKEWQSRLEKELAETQSS